MQRLQPNFTTDGIRNFMAQQKQRKQPILINGKNIFTHCFQSIQRLQSNCKTYAIRNFMHTKHNGDNRKLRIVGRVAWWLATCARKPKVPGSSLAASYVQR